MEQEKKVLEKLAEAWNEFLKLEKQHPDEISDFCDGIHKCQLVIGMRFARESNPEIFPKKSKDEPYWKVWRGWRGNHDQRIEGSTCSKCGYECQTVYGSLDKLPKHCGGCGSEMMGIKEN